MTIVETTTAKVITNGRKEEEEIIGKIIIMKEKGTGDMIGVVKALKDQSMPIEENQRHRPLGEKPHRDTFP